MDETKKPEGIVKAVESVESALPELPEAQLNQVVGGTKLIDKASPDLFLKCTTGKHYDEAK